MILTVCDQITININIFVPDYKYREVINHSSRNPNENFRALIEKKITSRIFQKNIDYIYLFICLRLLFNVELIFPNVFFDYGKMNKLVKIIFCSYLSIII